MKHARPLPRSTERDLYLHAIDVLCADFKRMGLTPTIGVEFEFYVYDRLDQGKALYANDEPINSRQVRKIQKALTEEFKDETRLTTQKIPFITRFYKDIASNKYESVCAPLFACSNAIEAIEKMKTRIRDLVNGDDSLEYANYWVTHNANSFTGDKIDSPALHTSVGLMTDGKDVFSNGSASDALKKLKCLGEYMKPGLQSLMLLFAHKPSCYSRFESAYDGVYPDTISVTEIKGQGRIRVRTCFYSNQPEQGDKPIPSSYVENRLPRSDTPIYKAALGTLLVEHAAIKEALEFDANGRAVFEDGCVVQKRNCASFPPDLDIPGSMKVAAECFKESKPLWDALDALPGANGVGAKIYVHELERYKDICRRQEVAGAAR